MIRLLISKRRDADWVSSSWYEKNLHTSKVIHDKRCRNILHITKAVCGERYRNILHTNIVISDKWVLFGMWIQKSDAKRIVPTEMISIETYAGEPVSKHSDSEYAYANAIESALPRTT